MSGHSKWATIKRQKGANDAKRGIAFTKLSNAISIAVRQGGGIGDPDQNFKLRLAVDAARNANMPKENIERAIQRALGKGEGEDVMEALYEGFGQQGICILVDAVTNNKNRTIGDVKSTFDKNGGTMGQSGSVSYQFKQVGQLVVDKGEKSLDDIFFEAVDNGAIDIEEAGEEAIIYTEPNDLAKAKNALIELGYTVKEMDIIWQPLTTIQIPENDPVAEKIVHLLEKLEDLDDVQKVYSNLELV